MLLPRLISSASMYSTTLSNSFSFRFFPSIFVLAAINFYTWFLGILLCFFDWGGDSTQIRRFFFWTDRAAYLFWATCASCCQQHRENCSHHDHYACVFRVFFPPYLVLISAYLTKYFLVWLSCLHRNGQISSFCSISREAAKARRTISRSQRHVILCTREVCTLGMAHTHSFALPLRWRTGPHLPDSFA